ncbi:hypothetical protein F5Y04DRAFT_256498 [Hypomontagnella monticulosa]|nr:hypothetical protein F5Y04DRAFT_256498 [Hypomontagnella monticulosa]
MPVCVSVCALRNQVVCPTQLGMTGPFRILDLPADLFWYILSFLGFEEVVLFSLTCKDVYHLVRRAKKGRSCFATLRRPLNVRPGLEFALERVNFLHLLEDDYPGLFVCACCFKLHPSLTGEGEGEGRLTRHYSGFAHGYIDREYRGMLMFGALWPQYVIGRHPTFGIGAGKIDVQGPSFLNPEFSSISTDWEFAKLGTLCNNPYLLHGYVKLDTETVVANGSLFFHKIQRILLLPEKTKAFIRTLDTSFMEQVYSTCCHDYGFKDVFQPSLRMINWRDFENMSVRDTISKFIKMAQDKISLPTPAGLEGWDLEAFELRPYSLAGCARCTTDYAITIHNHGSGGVEIVLDVFQDLGDNVNKKWEHCWSDAYVRDMFDTALRRRLDPRYPAVDPRIFPTPPGKSAIGHPSTPTTRDIQDLHEHERKMMLQLPRDVLRKIRRRQYEQGLT